MAFSKKGWRKIVVEDHAFYWQAVEDRFSWETGALTEPNILHSRPQREPHRHLVVKSDRCGETPGFSEIVSPRIVRGCIESAILSGWLDAHPSMKLVLLDFPLRHVVFDSNWRASTVVSIAQAMYDSRDFAPMPLLADALQDAGCEQPDILDHCRTGQTHVRGCWVVDLILGKE
jgi:hypothetical protein